MRGLGKIALTLVAILAYRNRDKLSEWLKAGRQRRADKGPDIEHPDDAGTIERLIDGFGSGDGIAEILDQFRNAGAEESVEFWIGNGPNRPLTARRGQGRYRR